MKTIHYINLTNGIEAIESHNLTEYRFIRIQSTLCEAKAWEKLILNLDDDFLMNLALGNNCVVYDFSAHKESPRAVYQGLEFVKYILNRRWFGREIRMHIRGMAVDMTFYEKEYNRTIARNKDVKRKLDYFKKFLNTEILLLTSVVGKTENDGNNNFYRNIIIRENEKI